MAKFVCRACSRPTLEIRESLEVPADARWDELSLQTLSCSACGFTGVAIYEESRRGALDSEIWNHTGFSFEQAEALGKKISSCPEPSNRRCTCSVHQELGAQDERGFWLWPKQLDYGTSFAIKRP